MDSCEDDDVKQNKRKRGHTNVQKYKNSVIKKARLTGEASINWSGKYIAAKTPGEHSRCRRKCYTVISEQEKKVILSKFRSFETKNEQDIYLQSLISTTKVHRRRRRKPAEESSKPSRGCTFVYEISTCSGKYQVCKKAFVNIHGITDDRVRRLSSLLCEGKSPRDKRGRNVPGNAKSGNVIDAVKSHIASFPVKTSHYSVREYHYLDAKLNVKIMHSLYTHDCPGQTVSYDYYLKIFKENFSLSFGRPQVDTCCRCEELNVKLKSTFLNDTAKRVIEAEKQVHLRRAKKFYSTLQAIENLSKTDETVCGICIDYMQNLHIPCVPIQEAFYLRQLTVSVFCIHNLKDGSAYFFVYHEGVAGKGPNEVCTFLMRYIESAVSKSVKHLHIFSDGCGAQNRNHTIIRLFSTLTTTGRFETVDQYYPMRGHSFLPCDRDFAILKRKIKRRDRVYMVKEYMEIILTSSNKQAFLAILIEDSTEIIDFKSWWPFYFKKSMLSAEFAGRSIPKDRKVTLQPSKFMHFSHTSTTPSVVVARDYINGLLTSTFHIRNTRKGMIALPTTTAYPAGKCHIQKKNMEDLRKLSMYLPHDVMCSSSIKNFSTGLHAIRMSLMLHETKRKLLNML